MVKRSLIGVALPRSLVAGALVTAPPAAASLAACGPGPSWSTTPHSRLEVQSCIRHTAGYYYSFGIYACMYSGTFDYPIQTSSSAA